MNSSLLQALLNALGDILSIGNGHTPSYCSVWIWPPGSLKVTSERERDVIAKPFFDVRLRRILLASMRKGRTVDELSRLSGIPSGSCCRKVHTLVREHLLRVSSFVKTPDGRRLARYRCGFDRVSVSLKSTGFSLEVTPHRRNA